MKISPLMQEQDGIVYCGFENGRCRNKYCTSVVYDDEAWCKNINQTALVCQLLKRIRIMLQNQFIREWVYISTILIMIN